MELDLKYTVIEDALEVYLKLGTESSSGPSLVPCCINSLTAKILQLEESDLTSAHEGTGK